MQSNGLVGSPNVLAMYGNVWKLMARCDNLLQCIATHDRVCCYCNYLFTVVVEIFFHIATPTLAPLSLLGASHNIRIFSFSQLHFPTFPLFTCHTTAAIQLLSIPAPPQSLICGEEVCFCPNYATLFSVTSAHCQWRRGLTCKSLPHATFSQTNPSHLPRSPVS